MEGPYSSPKAQSPNVNRSGGIPSSQNEAGGNLKLSIALGQKGPTIIHKGPFYLVVKQDEKEFDPPEGTITGATNLMANKQLEKSYEKLTTKKIKDTLQSFLPQLPGVVDTPGTQDNSSLRGLIEKPPVCGKELHSLTPLQLSGFRLHPGPLPEQYRHSMIVQTKRKKSKKTKNRHKGSETPATDDQNATGSRNDSEEREKRKEKKHKKHERDAEERKKKKKEKKKKRSKEDKDI